MTQRAFLVAGAILILVAGYLAWQPVSLFLAVDGCMDQGGSFDYVTQTCDFETSHPYVSHDESDRNYFLAAIVVGVFGLASMVIARRSRSELKRTAQ
jgi:hypothetical protein